MKRGKTAREPTPGVQERGRWRRGEPNPSVFLNERLCLMHHVRIRTTCVGSDEARKSPSAIPSFGGGCTSERGRGISVMFGGM